MMKTRITELLGTKYPVIQGGMAWVADAELAAAVSNAGGCGLIAGGSAPADIVREQIRKAKTLTDRPFGVNIMLMNPNTEDLAKLVIEEGVQVVTTGAGNPGKYIAAWKEAGIKVLPVVPSVALAKRMERAGADAVICEGMEAGGHIGQITTMCMVPQIVDAVSIPVVAAGGIADGRGIAAVTTLGAEGVQLGTVFLASEECNIHENYKQLVLKAKDTDSAITGQSIGLPVRCIKNRLSRKINEMEKTGMSPEELESFTVGSLRKAVQDGDLENGSFMCGQIAGMVNEVRPVKEIIETMFAQAEEILQNPCAGRGIQLG